MSDSFNTTLRAGIRSVYGTGQVIVGIRSESGSQVKKWVSGQNVGLRSENWSQVKMGLRSKSVSQVKK